MSKHLIIDADSLTYRLAHSLDKEDELAIEPLVLDDIEGAFEGNTEKNYTKLIQDTLDYWMEINGASSYEMHFTLGNRTKELFRQKCGRDPVPCFRYAINDLPEPYKSNRKYTEVSKYQYPILECAVLNFNSFCHDIVEADDVVVYRKEILPEALLCALDKDVLNQVEGIHFNYGRFEPHVTTAKYANYYKYYQAIVGDPSDGYKGVPGIGEAKVGSFINEDMSDEELWLGTLEAYQSKGLSRKEAIATLRIADMTQLEEMSDSLTPEYYTLQIIWEWCKCTLERQCKG